MTPVSLSNQDWPSIVDRLGGAAALTQLARQTKAFLRPRRIATAVDLLRLILGYCLGGQGLRLTAGWAAAVGLADISNVALLYRLQHCGDWLAALVARALVAGAPLPSHGRVIRLIDATVGAAGRRGCPPAQPSVAPP